MDQSRRQKINDVVELENTINQLDIMDISGPLHPKTAESLFSLAHMEHLQRQTIFRDIKQILTSLKE